jgi:hypothetical protein
MASILAAEQTATTVSPTALTDRIDINRAILPGWNSIFVDAQSDCSYTHKRSNIG